MADNLNANVKLRPVLIRADALGRGVPARDRRVSRQHRIIVSSVIAQRMFGVSDVLVSAIRLTNLLGIDVDTTALPITYFLLLFDKHEVICADGAQTESLLAGPAAMETLSHEARHEILTLFPELSQGPTPASAVHIPARRGAARTDQIDRAPQPQWPRPPTGFGHTTDCVLLRYWPRPRSSAATVMRRT
jgi:hypothetical protein